MNTPANPVNIDPKVDCVFKALFGKKENSDLLIHFLNSVLELKGDNRVKEIMVEKADLEKAHLNQKEPVVDVIAIDQKARKHHIEIQLANHAGLPERMLYSWARIYSNRFMKGQRYQDLRPVISIWLLGQTLFPQTRGFHTIFNLTSSEDELHLSDHFALHIFQLRKMVENVKIRNDKDRWIYFFNEGEKLDPRNLPYTIDIPEIRKAMSVLELFNLEEAARNAYESSLTRRRVENTMRTELNQALSENRDLKTLLGQAEAGKQQVEAETRRLQSEKQQAEAETRRLQSEKQQAEAETRRLQSELLNLEARFQKHEMALAKLLKANDLENLET